jgi:ceramide glucosyltransferase
MIFIFYTLAAVLIYFSYRSFRSGIEYLNFFKRELEKPISDFTPFVSIIAPCKGLDHEFEENLTALLSQDHPAYEVIFVVDDEADASVEVIRHVERKHSHIETKLVIAEKAERSGQKVENLREAVLHVSDASELFVFVDSDARPTADWLRSLTAPLADPDVGAATGYRWFISKTPNFASELRSVWNASVASALGPNKSSNFCWGGATAIRRDVFERLNVREKWRGTLSDDFALTRILNSARLPIHFVPRAITASIENCSLRELYEFTTRQMKITRVYAPHLWKMSFFGSGLFSFVMAAGLLIIIFSPHNNYAVWYSITTLALVSIFSVAKAWIRLYAVQLALPEYSRELRRQYFPQCTLWVFAPALFFANCVAALTSKHLKWRGISYELTSSTETRVH